MKMNVLALSGILTLAMGCGKPASPDTESSRTTERNSKTTTDLTKSTERAPANRKEAAGKLQDKLLVLEYQQAVCLGICIRCGMSNAAIEKAGQTTEYSSTNPIPREGVENPQPSFFVQNGIGGLIAGQTIGTHAEAESALKGLNSEYDAVRRELDAAGLPIPHLPECKRCEGRRILRTRRHGESTLITCPACGGLGLDCSSQQVADVKQIMGNDKKPETSSKSRQTASESPVGEKKTLRRLNQTREQVIDEINLHNSVGVDTKIDVEYEGKQADKRVVEISIGGEWLADEDLFPNLNALDSLRVLNLSDAPITGMCFVRIDRLTSLQRLDLTRTKVSDENLEHLKGLTGLRQLILTRTAISDAGLVHLNSLTNLEWLSLWSTATGDAGLAHLKRLKKLTNLNLSFTRITDEGLASLQNLTDLEILTLKDTAVSDSGLVHLERMTKLEDLWLADTQVTASGISRLKQKLPKLEVHC